MGYNATFTDSLALAQLHRKLDVLDVDFVMESIAKQLKNPIENNINRDYLKRFEKQYKDIKDNEKYDPEIDDQRDILYLDIKNKLESFLDISISEDDNQLPKVCKHMYRFFVVDLIDNISKFLEMYIILHTKEVVGMLTYNKNNVSLISTKESFPSNEDMAIIVANIAQAVNSIAEAPISFKTFLETIDEHVDATPSAEMINKYYMDNIEENTSIYHNIMIPIINENEGYGSILNKLNMRLFNKFGTVKELEEGHEFKEKQE